MLNGHTGVIAENFKQFSTGIGDCIRQTSQGPSLLYKDGPCRCEKCVVIVELRDEKIPQFCVGFVFKN